MKEGADGVTLLKYQPKKGVIVPKLTGSLEREESYETYQSRQQSLRNSECKLGA